LKIAQAFSAETGVPAADLRAHLRPVSFEGHPAWVPAEREPFLAVRELVADAAAVACEEEAEEEAAAAGVVAETVAEDPLAVPLLLPPAAVLAMPCPSCSCGRL
jgi:hypothetical protein